MPAKDKKKKTAPLSEDLTPLSPEAAALVEAWLTASRAEKAAKRIKQQFEGAMLALVQQLRLIKVPAGVIHLGESVSYDYPAEITALDELSAALKKAAKKEGTASREAKPCVEVEDYQQFVDPPTVAETAVMHGLKAWLHSLFKRPA